MRACRQRIARGAEDHLRSDDGALERFGAPAGRRERLRRRSWGPARRAGPRSEALLRSASREPSMPSRSSAPRSPGTRRPTRRRSWPRLALVSVIVAPPGLVREPARSRSCASCARREPVMAECGADGDQPANRCVALVFGLRHDGRARVLAFELRNDSAGWWVAAHAGRGGGRDHAPRARRASAAVAARLRPTSRRRRR